MKKLIPKPDLKLLIDFLKVCIEPDLEFQAVYDAVLDSFTLQTRLFKALTDKKDAFVDVRISRKPRKILLKFSFLPDSLASGAIAESKEKMQSVENDQIVVNDPLPVDSLPPELEAPEVKKRRGRGKAKKQTPSRSLVSVLIDDSYITALNQLAIDKDLTLSYLVRVAVRQYLNSVRR